MDNMNSLTNPLVIGDAVLQMIPQKPPMVMIDTIIAVSSQRTSTALTIMKDNIFCADGFFQAPGLSENIAQTAAAQAGYLSNLKGEAAPVGFIAAIKNLSIEQLPKIGDQLITEIVIEHEVMNFTLISGISKVGEQIMAKCQMKIFIADTEQA